MSKSILRALSAFAIAVAALTSADAPACAHPHVWVTLGGQLIFAADGSATGVRYDWAFDDMFSAFALQGIKAKKAGDYPRQELAPLAEKNVTSLKEYRYFTYAKVNGKKIEVGEPTDYYLDYDRKTAILTLHFSCRSRLRSIPGNSISRSTIPSSSSISSSRRSKSR
jgi:ABC-type uncharacterized transport system substrate-binding protein